MSVSPWVFYLAAFLSVARFWFGVAAFLSTIASMGFIPIAFPRDTCCEDREERLWAYKWTRNLMLINVALILAFSLVPSRDTFLMMYATKIAEQGNASDVFLNLKAAIDYAYEVFK